MSFSVYFSTFQKSLLTLLFTLGFISCSDGTGTPSHDLYHFDSGADSQVADVGSDTSENDFQTGDTAGDTTPEDTLTDTGAADTGAADTDAAMVDIQPTDLVQDEGMDQAQSPDSGTDIDTDIVADAGEDAVDDTVDDTGSQDVSDADSIDTSTPELLIRIVAGNLTSGNYQSYDPGHGMRILQGLQPDIVLVQEMNYGSNSSADYVGFAQAIVGTSYWAIDDSGFQLPNGVISRWPITDSGYWDDPNLENRELMWAEIDLPCDRDLLAVSVHLHTSPAVDQVEAAQVIASAVEAHKAANPGMYFYVVGGDFNGPSALDDNAFGLYGDFHVDPPHPVDDEDNKNTSANRSHQYDFVLAGADLHAYQIPVVFESAIDTGTRTYPDGFVFDTRTISQSQLDEYFSPAQTGDSAASSMTHMAVAKDFLIY